MGDWRVYDIMIDTGAVACGAGRPEGWYQRYFLVPPARGCGVLQSACQYVCLSVSAHISQKPRIQTWTSFLLDLPVVPMSRCSGDVSAMRCIRCVPEKRPTLFLEWLCQKLTDFYMILGVLSREKIWHERLTDLFTSLSGVRSHFQQWSYSKNEKVSVFGTRCTSSFMDDVVFARVLKESNVKPYTSLLCLEYCVINWY